MATQTRSWAGLWLPAAAAVLLLLALAPSDAQARRPTGAKGVSCGADVLAANPGCLYCNSTGADGVCVACRDNKKYALNNDTGLCECAAGYGSTMPDWVLGRPASWKDICSMDPAAPNADRCTCSKCVKGTTTSGAQPVNASSCDIAGAITVFFSAADNGAANFDIYSGGFTVAFSNPTLNATDDTPAPFGFNITANGLLLGRNDCNDEINGFKAAVMTGATVNNDYYIYSYVIGETSTSSPDKLRLDVVDTADPTECESRGNMPFKIKKANSLAKTQASAGKRCWSPIGHQLQFTALYGRKNTGQGCTAEKKNFIRIKSITFVPASVTPPP